MIYNELINVKIPSNIIPGTALSGLHSMLYREDHKSLARIVGTRMGDWENQSNPWTLWEADHSWDNRKYSGKWTKRFTSYLYKEWGMKVEDSLISKIGEMMGKYQKDENLFFQITKRFSWTPGDFKEKPNSCWWGSYEYVRLGLSVDENAFAVLFYENEKQFEKTEGKQGIGRCWMLDEGKYSYIFNAYGVSLSTTATALSKHFGVENRKIQIQSESAWLNMGNLNNENGEGGGQGIAYVLGNDDLPETDKIIVLRAFSYNKLSCTKCGKEDKAANKKHTEIKGQIYCTVCAKDFMCTCSRCDRRFDADLNTRRYVGGDDYFNVCPACERDVYRKPEEYQCEIHGNCYQVTTKIWHTSKRYCADCYRNGIFKQCFSCGHYVMSYTSLLLRPSQSSTHVCSPCAKSYRKQLLENKHEN